MFELRETGLPGCMELQGVLRDDARGSFLKTFHADFFRSAGLRTDFREQYFSISTKGVLRGLHFQRPPHDHAKLVYCTQGEVMDVVVDLRAGSPAFGQHARLDLGARRGNLVYIPSGLAHGFITGSDSATLVYNVTSVHAPESDSGIRWDSAGVDWGAATPLVSDRDAGLPPLSQFSTPFSFSASQDHA